jgi:hypothetical protein
MLDGLYIWCFILEREIWRDLERFGERDRDLERERERERERRFGKRERRFARASTPSQPCQAPLGEGGSFTREGAAEGRGHDSRWWPGEQGGGE